MQGAGAASATQRYRPSTESDEESLKAAIIHLSSDYGRYEYRRIQALLEREGWQVNHKRIERVTHFRIHFGWHFWLIIVRGTIVGLHRATTKKPSRVSS